MKKRIAERKPYKYNFKDGQELFDWWVYEKKPLQGGLFDSGIFND